MIAAVDSAAQATVYVDSINTGVTGLTPGTVYFLSATAGLATATAPSAAGNVVQEIGMATAAGELIFQPRGRGYVKA